MSEECLKVRVEAGVATLTMNRPDAGNAIDMTMANALLDAAIQCDEDAAIRCVVLTGVGRYFCVGGDIAAFVGAGENLPRLTKSMTAGLHMAVSRFARMNKPLITAINGPAAGAGLSLACLGDIALAAPIAHFSSAYTAIGFTPDGGLSYLLPRLVGMRKAQEMILTNTRVSAQDAAAMGLITRVVEAADLDTEVAKLAASMAKQATGALGQARRLLLQTYGESLEGQLENEARTVADASRSPHGREGVAAFVAKRPAKFE